MKVMRGKYCATSAFVVFVFAAVMLGCDSSSESSLGNLSGVVRDSTSNDPVPGASVRVPGKQQTTAADGRFEFVGVATGTVDLEVGASGFSFFSQPITLNEGENTHDVRLTRALYYDAESGGFDFTLRVPPSMASVRGVLLVLAGAGEESRTFVRGGILHTTDLADFRPRLLELADQFDLALMGSEFDGDSGFPTIMDEAFGVLDEYAVSANHPELTGAPILVEGYSLGGCAAYAVPLARVDRMIGFIRQKASCQGADGDRGDRKLIPGYHVIGDLDTEERRVNITAEFEANRQAGALWALITEPNAAHTEIERTAAGRDLTIDWMEVVLERRLPPAGGPLVPLLTIDEASGWLGNRETFEIGSYACYAADKLQASWFPSMETAVQWQALSSSGSVTTMCI